MTASNAKARRSVPAATPHDLRQGLTKAIEHFGSQGKLAHAIGVKQPSIAGAVLRGRLSRELAERVHDASEGEVPKWVVRPDLFKRGGGER